jgi:hypothetical protein
MAKTIKRVYKPAQPDAHKAKVRKEYLVNVGTAEAEHNNSAAH